MDERLLAAAIDLSPPGAGCGRPSVRRSTCHRRRRTT